MKNIETKEDLKKATDLALTVSMIMVKTEQKSLELKMLQKKYFVQFQRLLKLILTATLQVSL